MREETRYSAAGHGVPEHDDEKSDGQEIGWMENSVNTDVKVKY